MDNTTESVYTVLDSLFKRLKIATERVTWDLWTLQRGLSPRSAELKLFSVRIAGRLEQDQLSEMISEIWALEGFVSVSPHALSFLLDVVPVHEGNPEVN